VTAWPALQAVADRTTACDFTIWGFGVGGALSGLVRAGEETRTPAYANFVTGLVRPSLTAARDPTDHLISVEALLALAQARPDLRVDDACQRWTRTVLDAERPVPGEPRVHRPDLQRWSSTIWVDCMHTDGPGLALFGYTDEAVAAAEEYAAALQRPDGLFHHGYDVSSGRGNGVAWGRGQAWAMLGLLGTLEHADDPGLRHRLERLVGALARHEREGNWGTVVDDPSAPVERSVGAYVAWAVPRAVGLGLVDRGYAAMAERAYSAMLSALDHGALTCSSATPVGAAEAYKRQGTGTYPWGQAPVLHALLDRLAEEGEPR
jgi:rhamnogalacturonyl hydrolase YesR